MLDTAFEALARRDAVAALAAAQSAVAAEPERADAHQALGLAQQLSGDFVAAAAALERAIALAPNRPELHLARASLAIGQRDAAAADAALSAAVTADPNSLGAYLMALHVAVGRGQLDEARRQLQLAERVAADDPQVTAAAGAIALAGNDHAEAIRLLSKAVQALPEDPLVLAALGLAYRAAGNHAFAEGALVKAIERQPQAVALRWALIDSLRRQGRESEAVDPLRELLKLQPEDRPALALLGDVLMRRGEAEAGLDAYLQLILLPPFQAAPLDRLLQRLVQAGMRERAVAILERMLQAFPNEELLWQRRMQAAQGDVEAMDAVLARWLEALPDSAMARSGRAEFEEWRGNLAEAEACAQRALEQSPGMLSAEHILLRAELRSDPAAALARIQRLQAGEPAPEWQRALRFWRGQANDRLGQPAAALQAWNDAWASTQGGEPLPEPPARVDDVNPGAQDGPAPKLLWAPPGGRPRDVLAMLARVPGFAVLDDRFSSAARADGFGPARSDGAMADRTGWRSLIEQLGGDPNRCIDWLPHWDARVAAALPGAQLVAVIADPRDLLLNWMAFASPFRVRFPGPAAAAEWLRGALEPLAERIEAGDPNLVVVRDTELEAAPADVAARLQTALGLDALPDAEAAGAFRLGMGSLPVVFAPGHWRAYAAALSGPFAALAPLAQRLGYPLD